VAILPLELGFSNARLEWPKCGVSRRSWGCRISFRKKCTK